jgi:hypothetical protein
LLGARCASAVRRLHLRGDDVQVSLAIHAVHVDVVAVVIEHVHADRDVLGGRKLLARLGDAFGGRQIDGVEILNLFGGLPLTTNCDGTFCADSDVPNATASAAIAIAVMRTFMQTLPCWTRILLD